MANGRQNCGQSVGSFCKFAGCNGGQWDLTGINIGIRPVDDQEGILLILEERAFSKASSILDSTLIV